jgi:hypothetical protein
MSILTQASPYLAARGAGAGLLGEVREHPGIVRGDTEEFVPPPWKPPAPKFRSRQWGFSSRQSDCLLPSEAASSSAPVWQLGESGPLVSISSAASCTILRYRR